MNQDFYEIHSHILGKCKSYPFIKKEIIHNGIITIEDSNLDLFSFLLKIIISQQISDKASKTIWEKLCVECKTKFLSISNFPSINFLDRILNKINVAAYKRKYILELFKSILKKKIDIKKIIKMDEEEIRNNIQKHKGMGPWTCDMFLIFYLKKINVFPQKDLIIRKMKLKLEEKEGAKINYVKNFSPFLSIFSLHLWKMSERVL